jgi:hypothetical protein
MANARLAGAKSLEEVLAIVGDSEGRKFTAENVSTACHRVAKFASAERRSRHVQRDPRFQVRSQPSVNLQ